MLKRLGLRTRIYVILGLLAFASLASGCITIYLSSRLGTVSASTIDTHLRALQSTQELEVSLALERGIISSHFLDPNQEFARQIEHSSRIVEEGIRKARGLSLSVQQREVLNEIESKYLRYAHSREQIMMAGGGSGRTVEHKSPQDLNSQLPEIVSLLQRYGQFHEKALAEAREEIDKRRTAVQVVLLTAMPISLILCFFLLYILFAQILEPIRTLAMEADPNCEEKCMGDEVDALSRRVHTLMKDVDQTQSELQQSREHLVQSEKLAMVGKLAAGVAHSVRNPLTSVKMRLFSMERTLDLTPPEKEDFDVISEEIRHIDTILQNFLEFSRPPKLKIQKVSPSDVVDMAIQLLRHRIESYGVGVELYRQNRLQEIEGDPEQLKEVLVNLMINACEAMGEGGQIVIREEEGFAEPLGRVVVIRVSDNGPGIPESIRERVFQPFFSTKEEGTGLGLSIATRIIEDHKGSLQLRSRRGKGATFTITLPSKERSAWIRS